jgi:transcriptional regulator with XRE-family HTH domain
MPSREENKRKVTSRKIAVNQARRIKLVSALQAYLEKTELPVRQIVEEIGATRDAIRSWQSGIAKPRFRHLDGIAAFLKRHRNDRRLSYKVLARFERFYKESSLSDHQIAVLLGVAAQTFLNWRARRHKPRKISVETIERLLKKYGPEYLRP